MKYLIISILLFLFFIHPVFSTEYFVNNLTGNDNNNGSAPETPWKTIQKLESFNFKPGDVINFACGSVWQKASWESIFKIDKSGTAEKPIIFKAYGTGEKPTFINGGQVWNKGIQIDADFIILEGLRVINTGYCGFVLEKDSRYNIIRNCEVSNCGMGILCYGSDNLFTGNYIHDLKMIVDNEIPDTVRGGGDFGCVSFWLYGPDNEVSYNTSINNIGHSYDYITDGGFLEFYENSDGTYAHHNWIENGNGIAEGSMGTGKNITIAYNVFIENGGFFALHNNFEVRNLKFENNTCITRKGTLWNNMINLYPGSINSKEVIIRNNIFVLGGDASERITKNNNFTHTHNLYYLLDGAQLGELIPGEGEIVANPKFIDLDGKNLKLQQNSPAINAGIKLNYNSDFENMPVPVDNLPDLGAFEHN